MEKILLFTSIFLNLNARVAFEEFMKIARPEPIAGIYTNYCDLPQWMLNIKAQRIFNYICLVPVILVLVDMGWGFMHMKWWEVLLLTFCGYVATGIITYITIQKFDFNLIIYITISIPFSYISSILLWVFYT